MKSQCLKKILAAFVAVLIGILMFQIWINLSSKPNEQITGVNDAIENCVLDSDESLDAKVPMIRQTDVLDCGAASLAMILAYYGKWVPLEQVKVDCKVCSNGTNALNIMKAARNYGLRAEGFRYEPEDLMEEDNFPCIIHWNFNHFVVLNGFDGDAAYINDPAIGTVKVSMEEFEESFTGICLMFEPTESFEPGGKPNKYL